MPACVVKWCKNRSDQHTKSNDITFHIFPRNPSRKEQWIKAVQLERHDKDWWPSKKSTICSVHFKEDDFSLSKKGYRMLCKTSVPICTMVFSNEKPCTIETQPSISNEEQNIIEEEVASSSLKHQWMKNRVQQMCQSTSNEEIIIKQQDEEAPSPPLPQWMVFANEKPCTTVMRQSTSNEEIMIKQEVVEEEAPTPPKRPLIVMSDEKSRTIEMQQSTSNEEIFIKQEEEFEVPSSIIIKQEKEEVEGPSSSQPKLVSCPNCSHTFLL